jgi:hypothetical protein
VAARRLQYAGAARCSLHRALLFESNVQIPQVYSKRMQNSLRQDRNSILAALRVTNGQFAAFQTDVLDAQPQRFHQTQSAAIQKISR